MPNPLYPSLIPRYVDESWFASDQPVDEAAKLSELEANHDVWIREAQYRSVDVTPHIEPVDDEANDDADDEEINEDEDDDEEEIEDGDEMEEDFIPNGSPGQQI